MQTAIYPGRPWLDTQGNRIQAHAGGLSYENGQWYWYGENTEKTDGKNGIWTWGIRAYHSADLYNWTDCGLIIPPVLDNPDSNLAPAKAHRPAPHPQKSPHRAICLLAQALGQGCLLRAAHRSGAAGALHTGPGKTTARWAWTPATLISTRPRTAPPTCISTATTAVVYATALTEDYLDITGAVTEQYAGLHPPFVREGPSRCSATGTSTICSQAA